MKCQDFLDQLMLQVKHLREEAGLTQLDMAEKLKIGIRSYQRYESCDSAPPIDFLYHASAILGFNLKELMFPQDNLSSIGEVHFFGEDERNEFLERSGKDLTDLFSILKSLSFQQALIKNRPSILRDDISFQNSRDALSLSNIRTTLLNPSAQLAFDCTGDIIPTSSFHCNPKHVGILWGSLLLVKPAYFSLQNVLDTPSGNKTLHSSNVFLSVNKNHFIFGKLLLSPNP